MSHGFFMGRHEVTQAEFVRVMNSNPSWMIGDELPVNSVSWEEASAYCRELTRNEAAAGRLPEGYEYRLPTESEWEYAARAGSLARFVFGDDSAGQELAGYAWYAGNSGILPLPVGRRAANAWGVYDIHGNVAEWCADFYGQYLGGEETNPTGPLDGDYRVIRGCSYADDAKFCRLAFRRYDWVSERAPDVGFRVVLAPVRGAETAPIELVRIPAGSFVMGSPSSEVGHQFDEEPQMEVEFPNAFYASAHEITQGQYEKIMGVNPSWFSSGHPNRPVERVSWEDCMDFCRRLTEIDRSRGVLPNGMAYRLPTEAEWEYMARAGSATRFFFGDDPDVAEMDKYAWHFVSGHTFNGGGKTPNAFGLYDMYGNVAEWCMDSFDLYPGGPSRQFESAVDSAYRVIRGGAYSDDPIFLRSATRSFAEAAMQSQYVGFRVVLTLTNSPPASPMELVLVSPGRFLMGSSPHEVGHQEDERPVREVSISREFWIGKYEVTQYEYQVIMGENPSFYRGQLNRPVENVTWAEAAEFCRRLSDREMARGRVPVGYEYRLPTEAEWEYAARGGTTTRYSFGDDLDGVAIEAHARVITAPTAGVGSKLPNPWGIFDVHGNVAEWCHDWYGVYPGRAEVDPKGPAFGFDKVVRGGSWDVLYSDHRSAARHAADSSDRSAAIGFRVVLAPVLAP